MATREMAIDTRSMIVSCSSKAHLRRLALAPPWLKHVMEVVGLVCTLAFTLGMAVGGFKSAWGSLSAWEGYGTAWNPPIPAVLKPLILVVSVLMAIQAINNFIVDLRKPRD